MIVSFTHFLVDMGIDEEDITETSATDKFFFMKLENSIKLSTYKELSKSALVPTELLNGGIHCRDYDHSDIVKKIYRN